MTKEQKKAALIKYVEVLKRQISADIPSKYDNITKVDAYRQMLSIDLKKTLAKIETL